MNSESLHILLISREESSFDNFKMMLEAEKHIAVGFVDSAEKAMQILKQKRVDVAVVSDELSDKSGLQFIKELVVEHPFVNCALVSPLYAHEFHQQTEGLGVFMQLPVNPGAEAALEMIENLYKICQISNEFQKDGQSS